MRILLAEDEKRMAAALVALLKQEKYDVDHMADGASALAALESGVYDMAVLDVMMPEMNGFEVARRARNKGKNCWPGFAPLAVEAQAFRTAV